MGTLTAWYSESGPLMPYIFAAAGLALLVIADRFYAIVIRARADGRPFVERSLQLVRSGKLDEAIKLCTDSRAMLPDLGLLLLRSRSRSEPDLQRIAAAAELLLVPRVRRRLGYLPVIGLAAFLLGIAGCAVGLERALTAAAAAGSDAGSAFAAGAAVAFRPLMAGAVVTAGIALVHAYLASQAQSISEQIREYSARMISALIDQPDVRLGHR